MVVQKADDLTLPHPDTLEINGRTTVVQQRPDVPNVEAIATFAIEGLQLLESKEAIANGLDSLNLPIWTEDLLTGNRIERRMQLFQLVSWLANEAFEYLLGCSELNDSVRNLLWVCYDNRTGFEGALARLQRKGADTSDLRALTLALRGMFELMNKAFPGQQGPDMGGGHKAAKLLGHFDAIFTLNQDLLLERGYDPPMPRWSGIRLPGTVPLDPKKGQHHDLRLSDAPSNFTLASNFQPYFKLHGSSAFRTGSDSEDALLIMGGDKLASIDGNVLLKWYRDELVRHLALPDTRLLIIGYSFGDQHINQLLRAAATANTGLKMFIIDPSGVDVIDKRQMGMRAL